MVAVVRAFAKSSALPSILPMRYNLPTKNKISETRYINLYLCIGETEALEFLIYANAGRRRAKSPPVHACDYPCSPPVHL